MKNFKAILFLLIGISSCGSQGDGSATKQEDIKPSVVTEENGLIGNELKSFTEFTKPNDFINKMIFKQIDVIDLDLDQDSIEDEIFIYSLDSFELKDNKVVIADEPGDYAYIVIELSKNNSRDTFLLEDGVRKQFVNNINSDQYLIDKNEFFSLYKSGSNNLLIMEGYTYGSSESSQSIINVYNGTPVLIFHDDQRIESIETMGENDIKLVLNKKGANGYLGGSVKYKIDKWLIPDERD